MLNQIFSRFFAAVSPSTEHSTVKNIDNNPLMKKRGAEAIEDQEDSTRKRVRQRKEPQPVARLESRKSGTNKGGRNRYTSGSEEESDSGSESSTEATPVVTRSSRRVASRTATALQGNDSSSDDGSEYEESNSDCEEEDGEEEQPRRGKRIVDPSTIRRSSRTAVLQATQRPTTTPRTASYSERAPLQRSMSETQLNAGGSALFPSSALMRRSRRSRNVDVTKELVVMLPGDDPREMAQLDLRGEVEWDEFLIAMSEDTTMYNSDNEESAAAATSGSGALTSLHHSNSTYSMGGLALSGISGAPERPIRQRSTSTSSLNRGALDAQQMQFIDVLSVNNVSAPVEVHVPEVKEAPLFRTLSAINLLADAEGGSGEALALGRGVGSSSSGAGTKGKNSKDRQDTAALAQQLLSAKHQGGYDGEHYILPPKWRVVNEVYVDYDADSDDERFVAALQGRVRKYSGKGTASAGGNSNGNSPNRSTLPELKVRCVELMIARLEREFELARLFCSKSTGGGRQSPGLNPNSKDSKHDDISIPYETSRFAASAPVGAASQQTRAQLQTVLDGAKSSYKLTKRFLLQGLQPQGAPQAVAGAASSSAEKKSAINSPAAARFTRHGNVANSATAGARSPSDYGPLERLQEQQRQKSAALFGHGNTSASNLPDLVRGTSTGSGVGVARAVQPGSSSGSGGVGSNSTAAQQHRGPGRPPLIPRSTATAEAQHSKEAKYGTTRDLAAGSDEEDEDSYREYYSTAQIAEMLPETLTLQPLQSILRAFYNASDASATSTATDMTSPPAAVKNKVGRPPKVRTLSNLSTDSAVSVDPTAQESPYGAAREAFIAHEVYEYWRFKRSQCSTSMVRAYHRYIMDLWARADSVVVPMPSDYASRSLLDARAKLLSVRRALDRARLITDRVRRRERLKRDLVRQSSEQMEILLEELQWALTAKEANKEVKKESEPPPPPPRAKTPTPPKAIVPEGPHYISQGRDKTGKFLSNKETGRVSTAAKHKKANATQPHPPKAAAGEHVGPNRTGKSVRHEKIAFSLPPSSDTESDDESESEGFSSCSSSDTESTISIPPPPPAITITSTPRNAQSTAAATGRPVTPHSVSSSPSPQVVGKTGRRRTGKIEQVASPANSLRSSPRSTPSSTRTPDSTTGRRAASGKNTSRNNTAAGAKKASQERSGWTDDEGSPFTTRKHSTISRPAAAPTAKSTINGRTANGAHGVGRARVSVPECSLQKLPSSSTKRTPIVAKVDQPLKKRRL